MVTYKDILFCTDFSNNAQAALPYAIDLAKKYGASSPSTPCLPGSRPHR